MTYARSPSLLPAGGALHALLSVPLAELELEPALPKLIAVAELDAELALEQLLDARRRAQLRRP